MEQQKSYQVTIRLLGNEVFSISLATSSDSNRWVLLGLVTLFCTLTVLGAYGEQLLKIFNLT